MINNLDATGENLSVNEMRAVLDDGLKLALGFAHKEHALKWVHPKNVTGLDIQELVKINRARHYWRWFEDLDGVNYKEILNENYEGDDDVIFHYMEEVVSQRRSLVKKFPETELISGVTHLEAMIYMALEMESHLNFTEVDRYNLSYDEILRCLELFEAAFEKASYVHIKEHLVQTMDFFFCYAYLSPELDKLDNFKRFLADRNNVARMEFIHGLLENELKGPPISRP